MSVIKNLVISDSKNSASWSHNEHSIVINLENISQAIEDTVHNKVIVAICRGKYPYQIKVFSPEGNEEFAFKEPEPFEFYYLKKHSSYGVSIICTSDMPVDGRMDWQFEIDYKTGQLKRSAPSY